MFQGFLYLNRDKSFAFLCEYIIYIHRPSVYMFTAYILPIYICITENTYYCYLLLAYNFVLYINRIILSAYYITSYSIVLRTCNLVFVIIISVRCVLKLILYLYLTAAIFLVRMCAVTLLISVAPLTGFLISIICIRMRFNK